MSSNGSRHSNYSRSSKSSKNSNRSYSSSGSNVRHGRKYYNKNSSSNSSTKGSGDKPKGNYKSHTTDDEDQFIKKSRVNFVNKIKNSQSKSKRPGTPINEESACMKANTECIKKMNYDLPIIFNETLVKHVKNKLLNGTLEGLRNILKKFQSG